MKVVKREKIYFNLSLTLLVVSIISWIPYLVFDIQKLYGVSTFIINPIGMYFSYLCNSRALFFGNLFMLFSYIPAVIIVYLTKGYIPM